MEQCTAPTIVNTKKKFKYPKFHFKNTLNITQKTTNRLNY